MKYLYHPINRECPVCKYNSGKLLYTVDATQASQHFVLQESDKARNWKLKNLIQSLWGANVCSIIQCDNCNACFAFPFVAGDKKFYDIAYSRSNYPKWKWEFEKTLKRLVEIKSNFFPEKEIKILEIGAGDGSFTKRVLSDVTESKNILCIEYSEYGQKKIAEMQIRCISEHVLSLDPEKYSDYFDVVCMFQVLEHLDNLDELFDKLLKITTPRAHLFISVPNNLFIQFLEENGALLDMPPNHLSRWSNKSFVKLTSRFGLDLVEHQFQENRHFLSTSWVFAKFLFLRKSQESFSIANFITCSIKPPVLKRALQGIMAILYVFFNLKSCLFLVRSNEISPSQWVHFRKNET